MLKGYLKRFTNRLKMTYVYRELINNYFVIAFALLLFAIFINHFMAIGFVVLYCLYLYRQSKEVFLILMMIFLAFTIHFLIIKINYYVKETNEIEGTIIQIESKENYNKLFVKAKDYKKIVYDYDFMDLKPGDKIYVRGINLEVSGQRIENGFDYRAYLHHQKIDQVLQSEEIRVISTSFHLANISFLLHKYIARFPNKSQAFMKAIILGDDSGLPLDFAKGLQINGISHLFAVSGLHIGLLVIMIKKFLGLFQTSEQIVTIITIVILSGYLIATCAAASILRACLLYFGGLINKKGKFGLKTIDIIAIVFIVLLLFNPYYIYNTSFILSFLMAFMIILISPLIKKYHSQWQVLIISTIAIVITLPIIINFNNQMNLLSPLLNVVYIAFFSIFILPATLLVFILPFLANAYQYLLVVFEKIVIFSSKYINIRLVFPDFTEWQILIYYLLIIGIVYCFKKCCYRKMICGVFLLFLVVMAYYPVLNIKGEVSFLDLANGEAILVHTPFSECTALIDTGEGKSEEVTNFLLSKGIRKLDYLILTHNHSDHNGEAKTILKNIKVKNIITSKYDNSIYAATSITKKVGIDEQIMCGKTTFQVLNPKIRSEDENDNSLVLYVKIGALGFLFLGDVSKRIEEQIANYHIDVDVIKVAHHGSITSTNPILLATFKPKYAIIQTGRVAKFAFPHSQTITTLHQFGVITYQTNKDYSIKYTYTKKSSSFISWR
ncbi:MAG: DNA internalization-related competence protein ComEC/Rec2 [Bacilli bacterium]|nr:DNA internalization-related competence protein ComEC/Rec2 [Bacilli bacterium]MDD4056298.1 DNA internalization-related competence protein ComEC/Rec2 [Bacilli bacterium]